MAENQIQWFYGQQASYDAKLALNQIDESAMYIVTDSQRTYKGTTLVAANNVRMVTSLPAVSSAIPNVFYVVESEGNTTVSVLNSDKTAFTSLINTSALSIVTDQVKLSTDLTLNVGGSLGGITDGTTIVAGTNLTTILSKLMTKEIVPTASQPYANLSVSPSNTVECGTSQTEALSASLNPGSYTGKVTATGVTATGYTFTRKSNSDAAVTLATDQASGTYSDAAVTVPLGSLTYSVTIAHGAGATPVSNTGTEYPNVAIAAGSKSKSVTVTGVRKYFYVADTGSAAPASSAEIRALSQSGLNPSGSTSVAISIADGTKRVVIAYPASIGDVKSIKSAATNFDYAGSFTKTIVDVEGANGYVAASYNVYTYLAPGGLTADTYTAAL